MKRLFFVSLTVLFVAIAAPVFAATQKMGDKEVDASLVLGTAPASGFGTGFGINVGAGMMLPQVDPFLQARVELSYMEWSASDFGVTVTYTRIPIDAAFRYYIPTSQRELKVYLQGGMELSFDTAEAAANFGGQTYKASGSETHLGLTPGVGIELALKNNVGLVADTRLHIITDSYLTFQVGVAYHF